jgi:hypothetical protein
LAVTLTCNGVAEGTAVKWLANETAGTITAGDTILEGIADSTGTVSTALDYEGAFGAGLDVLVRARNQGFPAAAIADDGGVLTDETIESNDPSANDMIIFPTTPVADDAYYLGHPEEFNRFKIDITTAVAGTNINVFLEYWNGTIWTLPSDITSTTFFGITGGGLGYDQWGFTAPTNWATTTVNGQGPYYYVRLRFISATTFTTAPRGRLAQLDVTRYLPIPPSGDLVRTITSASHLAN